MRVDPVLIGFLAAIVVVVFLLFRNSRRRSIQSAGVANLGTVRQAGIANLSTAGNRIEINPPEDRDAPRNRFMRLVVFLLTVATLLYLPFQLGRLWGSFFGGPFVNLGGLVGILGGGYLLYLLFPRLTVYNEEWSGYVTQDPFSGSNIPYGPGLHFSYPWEQRNETGNKFLGVITREFSITVQTLTAQVVAEGTLQYAINLANITTFIGIDSSTIEEGLIAFLQSFLTRSYASLDAEQARAQIKQTNNELTDEFMGPTAHFTTQLEESFGIFVVSSFVKSLKLPPAVQKTRDAIDEGAILTQVIAKMLGITVQELVDKQKTGEISHKDYTNLLNRAMAVSDNATLNINAIEGDLGGALAAAVAQFLDNSSNKSNKRGSKK